MKQGLRPTKRQKIAIEAANLKPENWLVYKNTNGKLHIVHRTSGNTRVISS